LFFQKLAELSHYQEQGVNGRTTSNESERRNGKVAAIGLETSWHVF